MLVQIDPDRLRAGVSAPDPAQYRSEQKEAQPGHDQQPGNVVEFLWPDLDPEEEETPVGQIDQHRLVRQMRAAVPADPRRDIVNCQRDAHDPPLQPAVESCHCLGEDRFARGIKARAVGLRFGHRNSLPD